MSILFHKLNPNFTIVFQYSIRISIPIRALIDWLLLSSAGSWVWPSTLDVF